MLPQRNPISSIIFILFLLFLPIILIAYLLLLMFMFMGMEILDVIGLGKKVNTGFGSGFWIKENM